MFVAIDRTSKFAFVKLHEKAATRIVADVLFALIQAVPYNIHAVLNDNGTRFTDSGGRADLQGGCFRVRLRPRR